MESWKNVKGYEGFYKVSNLGRVKRIESFRKNGGSGYIQPEKVLSPVSRGKSGYICVHLSKNGKSKNIDIHRLVAIAFLENLENKSQVNHKNGNKEDNTVENLEWVTPSENILHAIKILNVKRNTEGLKLGAKASIKKNLNITNGDINFDNYKQITAFIKSNKKYKNVKDKYIKTHIRGCCIGRQKTAYGYKWEYIN